MYQWHKNLQVRYAYLADVCWGVTLWSDFGGSIWLTRGWTLQEFLAHSSAIFFDKDWIDTGTKASLEERILEITGIDDFVNFERACVAQKMSWVAKRRLPGWRIWQTVFWACSVSIYHLFMEKGKRPSWDYNSKSWKPRTTNPFLPSTCMIVRTFPTREAVILTDETDSVFWEEQRRFPRQGDKEAL